MKDGIVFPYQIPGRDIFILDCIWFSPMGHAGVCGIVVTENLVHERKILAGAFNSYSTPERDMIRIAEEGGKIVGDDLEKLFNKWLLGREDKS